jgi:hypothetical protein
MTRIAAILWISWVAFFVGVGAKPKFTATWKAPGVEGVAFAGKKVVGLIVSDDLSLSMSAEEALARELTAKGAQGVAAYRLIPREEIRNKDSARRWLEQSGAAGVVIMRLVNLSKETTPSAFVWQSASYYNSLWAYYPYAWGSTFDIGASRTDIKVVVEMMVFDIAGNRLLWAGTSESVNPGDAQALVTAIADSAADQMRKDGLINRR